MRILIVEDEPAIVRFLARGLAALGYQPIDVDNGEDAVVLATDELIDLVLLDISLPGIDGHEVLRRIRAARPQLPVLMLTARDDLQNKVRALDAGADDYLAKPFAFEELLARIRALARRGHQAQSAQIEIGDLQIDLVLRRVRRGTRTLDLSGREFALLEYFMRRPDQVLSREQILSAIWDYAYEPGSNVVDVYVRYLRRKIDRPDEPSMITTVRGVGYRFESAGSSRTQSGL